MSLSVQVLPTRRTLPEGEAEHEKLYSGCPQAIESYLTRSSCAPGRHVANSRGVICHRYEADSERLTQNGHNAMATQGADKQNDSWQHDANDAPAKTRAINHIWLEELIVHILLLLLQT